MPTELRPQDQLMRLAEAAKRLQEQSDRRAAETAKLPDAPRPEAVVIDQRTLPTT